MKRILCILLTVLTVSSILVTGASAGELLDEDVSLAEAEEVIESVTGIYDIEAASSSSTLIISSSLGLAKTSTKLEITASTLCASDVTKCGFTYIKLQRLINGTWVNYSAYCYSDLYDNSSYDNFSVSATVPHGYYYRVICEHYAEKPYLVFLKTTDTKYNETSSIYF
ncbi:MAG: hypothetical protein IJ766_10745 [Clostridia bacterium]|nr:hypothetical protein [Clostridia bacterium]